VILVDANVLIYAIDSDSPHHASARRWLEGALSGTTPVGLAWIVILAFLRLTTRSGILRNPLRVERAVEFIDEWLAQPYVRAVSPGDGHWTILRKLLRESGTAGNLTSDAHLAALALELGASICSTDADFERFPGVDRVSPLQQAAPRRREARFGPGDPLAGAGGSAGARRVRRPGRPPPLGKREGAPNTQVGGRVSR
jgi:toxin-antitoxin system PIN domain toxin